jgi:hypothetical protein
MPGVKLVASWKGSLIRGKRLLWSQFLVEASGEWELLFITGVNSEEPTLRQPDIGTAINAQGIKAASVRLRML